MKQIILCVAFSLLCGNEVSFGKDAEMVYIENGIICCRSSLTLCNAEFGLHMCETDSVGPGMHYFVRPEYPPCFKDTAVTSRFPLTWVIKDKTLKFIYPGNDPMGRITLEIIAIDDITQPTNIRKCLDFFSEVSTAGEIKTYTYRHRNLLGFRSRTFADILLSDSRNEVLWYSLGDTNFIARIPLAREYAYDQNNVWVPCTNPVKFRWMEFRYTGWDTGWDSYRERLECLHSQDIPSDGFTPVGSVRISNKRVLCDDPKAIFPKEADWLIWEKNGDNCRLCQMRGGQWSVCQDMTRKDAPRTIVVNNDSNTVFLLYSIGMDAKDVDGSLKKIVTFLRARGALSPRRKVNNGESGARPRFGWRFLREGDCFL